jgi:hypothetical protein
MPASSPLSPPGRNSLLAPPLHCLPGVRPGDRIVSVDGLPIGGKPVDEVKTLLRGDPGTQVALSLQRDGAAQGKAVELVVQRREVSLARGAYEWIRTHTPVLPFAATSSFPPIPPALHPLLPSDPLLPTCIPPALTIAPQAPFLGTAHAPLDTQAACHTLFQSPHPPTLHRRCACQTSSSPFYLLRALALRIPHSHIPSHSVPYPSALSLPTLFLTPSPLTLGAPPRRLARHSAASSSGYVKLATPPLPHPFRSLPTPSSPPYSRFVSPTSPSPLYSLPVPATSSSTVSRKGPQRSWPWHCCASSRCEKEEGEREVEEDRGARLLVIKRVVGGPK